MLAVETKTMPEVVELRSILTRLYESALAQTPGDPYVRQHASDAFVRGTVEVFRFYRPFLSPQSRILDWGCRHAPDACLLRAAFGEDIELEGCDFVDLEQYAAFHRAAGLRYTRLYDIFRLPYEDGAFDAVIASGVLEHVAMDYESLKEIYRVLRPGGRLVLTYLPNAASIEEWWKRARRRNDAHARLYRLSELRRLLVHTGFRPLRIGYQTRADLLSPAGALLQRAVRLSLAHRLTSCLCTVAEKVTVF
jgi:SAM-dependent methyltransferase